MEEHRIKALTNHSGAWCSVGKAVGDVGDGREEAGRGDGEGRRPRRGHHVTRKKRRLRVVAEGLHGAS